MSDEKPINIRQVWCFECLKKDTGSIRKSDFLVPLRVGYYDLTDDADIDKRVVGVCAECLETKNRFQRMNAIVLNVEHEHLVYRNPKVK